MGRAGALARVYAARMQDASLPQRPRRATPHATLAVDPWEPVRASAAYANWLSRVWEIWWTRSRGHREIDVVRRRRFDALVRHARTHSPFYRELYRGLPSRELDVAELPIASKPDLMASFDDWVTDRTLTLDGVEAFLADRRHIGERYLDRYVVWKSSGTTREAGIYVQDADALATFDALMAVQLDPARFAREHSWQLASGGTRAALVAATGGHYASIASWQRVCQSSPWIPARGFSIMEPLPRLVAQLNAYRPTFLASYPTMLALLTDEHRAGRLRIAPLRLWSGGECLPGALHAKIERAFGCPVVNEYGASECMSIAFGCPQGWLHVNADWVLLEPVDAQHRPVPPGERSHTVLLTNLANRTQPLIRYDLGDRVLAKPEPCVCGSPLPAIRVEGRCGDVVELSARDRSVVRLLPLALSTVVEEAIDAHRFQIVQTAADELKLRFEPGCDDRRTSADSPAWRAAEGALRRYLDQQSLSNVRVGLDPRRPVVDRRSGKMKDVLVAPSARAKPPAAPSALISPPLARRLCASRGRSAAGRRP